MVEIVVTSKQIKRWWLVEVGDCWWWLVVVGDESWWLVVGETIRQTNSGSRWGSPLWSLLSNTGYFLTDPRIFSTLRNKTTFQPTRAPVPSNSSSKRVCLEWWEYWRSNQNYSSLPFVPFEGQSYQAMSDENRVKQWDWKPKFDKMKRLWGLSTTDQDDHSHSDQNYVPHVRPAFFNKIGFFMG